jgi:hypothetical protein
MVAIAENRPHPANPLQGVEDWARQHTQQWCVMCDEFKELTRRTMLARQPSDAELEQHRRGMKIFLRMTRLLHTEVADPDFPDRSLAAELAIRLRQLEVLWEILYNPMAEEQANKLLQEAFPQ